MTKDKLIRGILTIAYLGSLQLIVAQSTFKKTVDSDNSLNYFLATHYSGQDTALWLGGYLGFAEDGSSFIGRLHNDGAALDGFFLNENQQIDSYTNSFRVLDLCVDPDQFYILGRNYYSNLVLVSIDGNMDAEWALNIHERHGQSNSLPPPEVLQTSDAIYILTKKKLGQEEDQLFPTLFKVDRDGNLQWELPFDSEEPSEEELEFSVMLEKAGQLYLSGIGLNPAGSFGTLTRVNTDGTVAWSYSYTDVSDPKLTWTPDGQLLMLGRFADGLSLLQLDTAGQVQWGRKVFLPEDVRQTLGNNFIGLRICYSPAGFILLGIGGDLRPTYFIKLDSSGNLLDSWVYPETSIITLLNNTIEALPDGTVFTIATSGKDDRLIRFDENGEVAACPVVPGCIDSLADFTPQPSPLAWNFPPGTADPFFIDVEVIPGSVALKDTCDFRPPDPTFTADYPLCSEESLRLGSASIYPFGQSSWVLSTGDTRTGKEPDFGPLDAAGDYQLTHRLRLGGCLYTFTDSFRVEPTVRVTLGNDTLLCRGEQLLLQPLLDPPADSIRWQDGSTQPTLLVDQPGTYWVEAAVVAECPASDTLVVLGAEQPTIRLEGPTQACTGDTVVLQADWSGDAQLPRWSTGEQAGAITVRSSGLYEAEVANACGIARQSLELVFEDCTVQLYIPTAFSPNGDGRNDLFEAFGNENVALQSMEIYSRWGDRMYAEQSPQPQWDGTFRGRPAQTGVYAYLIRYIDLLTQQERVASGEVVLMR